MPLLSCKRLETCFIRCTKYGLPAIILMCCGYYVITLLGRRYIDFSPAISESLNAQSTSSRKLSSMFSLVGWHFITKDDHSAKKQIVSKLNISAIKQNIGIDIIRVPFRARRSPSVSRKNMSKEHNIIGFHSRATIFKETTHYGEMGVPVILANLSSVEDKLQRRLYHEYNINVLVSDLISLNRSLPDVRPDGCKTQKYQKQLPKASIIICYFNEPFSVILRTVYSVLNRTPAHLLHEIILVDDFSDKPGLTNSVRINVDNIPKVKLITVEKRIGLIRARTLGAKIATAPALVFLDAHCECTVGWLEPLLSRLAESETNVVVPFIDSIDHHTLAYSSNANSISPYVGGFDWTLTFNWHLATARDIKSRINPWDPFFSPTMAGGLFAINKSYFKRLGYYDSALDYWGGENLELSFKVWLCGGRLETVACSHVGHIYRTVLPHTWIRDDNPTLRNRMRVALIWMDKYGKYFFERTVAVNDSTSPGDVSEQIELRKRLGCKNFEYFVKNVWPKMFVPYDEIVHAKGEITSVSDSEKCLENYNLPDDSSKTIVLGTCHGLKANQYWIWMRNGQVRQDEYCLTHHNDQINFALCDYVQKEQSRWLFYFGMIQTAYSEKCLEVLPSNKLVLRTCDENNEHQLWSVKGYSD